MSNTLSPTKKIAAAVLAASMMTAVAAPVVHAQTTVQDLQDLQDKMPDKEMKRILDNLQDAERRLKTGKKNYGGHREKALKAVREAISEVRKASRAAKNK